ncbi:MAG: DedA family protein/thiosulfate sulfurtransferase GlpE [Terriglobales bacterium]|jgi:membrane protein DedA with SNARE-associated domain/rhodanese-related sulfurtransferase
MFEVHQGLIGLARHGYALLFLWTAAEQLGAPVPAMPILIAAGVLSATGQLNLACALLVGMIACLIGDTAWYVIGKKRGPAVLRFLCKISLEPQTCVRRSSEFISRYGSWSLIFAKFVPGVSTFAVPLAANSDVSLLSFAGADFLGSLLYVGAYLAAGRLLGNSVNGISVVAASIRSASLILAFAAAVSILGWRFYQRRRAEHDLKAVARISPQEVRDLITAGANPYIIDLRHPLDMLADPRMIPGAIRLTPDELSKQNAEIPRDREIILYCTCPNEASSAILALKLRTMGISRIRPLLGGLDEWKRLGYPLEDATEKIGWHSAPVLA